MKRLPIIPLYTTLFMAITGCFAEPEYKRWQPVRHRSKQVNQQQEPTYESRRAIYISNQPNIPMEKRVKQSLSRLRHRLTDYKNRFPDETGSEFVRTMVAQTVHDLMRYEVTFTEEELSIQQYNDLFGRIRTIENMLRAEPQLRSTTWSAWGHKLTNDLDRLTMFTHGPLN
jgi:CRISPR/Cas system-associated endonuclease Cas1